MSEPVLAPHPDDTAEDAGWILSLVWNGARRASDVVILRAADLRLQAVLRLPLAVPHRLMTPARASLVTGMGESNKIRLRARLDGQPYPGPHQALNKMTTLSPSGMSPPGSRISEDDIKAKLSEFSESTELPIPVVLESWKVSYGYDYDGDASVYVSATVEDDNIEDGEDKYSHRNKLHSMIYKLVSRIIDPEFFIYVDLKSPSDLRELEELEEELED